ncbi:MAG: hypothetical protein QM597_05705 [Aeromicrobium sp.]
MILLAAIGFLALLSILELVRTLGTDDRGFTPPPPSHTPDMFEPGHRVR